MPFYQVFSKFDTAGEYGGIKLNKNILKEAVFAYVLSREKYFQSSFQKVYDEGNSADHTHKFSKVIKIHGWSGDAYKASYSVMSQKGLICMARLVYTKGSEELAQLMSDYKECRRLANAGPLKTFASDCLNIDGALWKKTFKDELTENVVPYQGTSSKHPVLGIKSDGYVYHDTKEKINHAARAISNAYGKKDLVVYGLDTECCWGDNDVKLVQVSFPAISGNEQKVHLFDLNAAGVFTHRDFPSGLKQLMLQKNLIPTGRAIGTDCTRLNDTFQVRISCYIELRGLALQADKALKATGLSDLAERFLSGQLNKHGQHGDYSAIPLPVSLQEYAALDALVSRLIYESISSRLLLPQRGVIYEGPETSKLDENTEVQLYIGGQSVAKCSIVYVAQKGMTRKWGMTTVAKGKVIVCLKEVFHENCHPPVSYKSASADKPSWKKENKTLQDLIGEEILVSASNLVLFVNGGNMKFTDSEFLRREIPDCDREGTLAGEGTTEEEVHVKDPFLTFADEDDDSEGDDGFYRSRSKEDIFHQFQNLPIGKLEPLRSIVSRLLIHATFIFHDEDFCKIEEHLQNKKGFDKNDPIYLDKLMNHFYFNREWWRERCRMYIADHLEHSARLTKVIEVMAKDPQLSTLMDADVKLYLETFVQKALRGEFEEQNDVYLFIRNGSDSYGLPMYYRLRGTVRTENLHQKMKTAIGPWAVGARTAHMMLLIICYRYNVQSAIRRCGAHDFGHCELHLTDRIQNRVQEIFNYLVWPRHKNMSFFGGNTNFVSVGIGPLSYDERYVIISDTPHPNLKGDKHFMAKQMGLLFPLLHVGSRAERRIIKEYMIDKRPTTDNFKRLAVIFKERSNGIDIFPKLPTMLKSYYKNIEKMGDKDMAESALVPDVNTLLRDFFCARTSEKIKDVPPTSENFQDGSKEMEADAAVAETGLDLHDVGNDNDTEMATEVQPLGEQRTQNPNTIMFVSPLQAPKHLAYIPANNGIEPIPGNERRCAWYPECTAPRKECGGLQRAQCCNFRHRVHDEAFVSQMLKKKATLSRDRKRRQMQAKREACKRQQAASN